MQKSRSEAVMKNAHKDQYIDELMQQLDYIERKHIADHGD